MEKAHLCEQAIKLIMRYFTVLLICVWWSNLSAQDHTPSEEKNALHYFSNGILTGQMRDFSMVTINKNELSDFYANAIGTSIHYETLPFKGFSVALNGIFVYRTVSNDLLATDSISKQFSRYELQLFDVEHKGEYTDLDRLEELYLKY